MPDAAAPLYHLAPLAAWRAFEASGAPDWRPPSLAGEGFVHLSFAHQLGGTLAAHFAGAGALALVELEPRALGAALRVEPSRGGALFPHLYAPLPRAAVRAVHALEPGPEGHRLPPLGAGPGAATGRGRGR